MCPAYACLYAHLCFFSNSACLFSFVLSYNVFIVWVLYGGMYFLKNMRVLFVLSLSTYVNTHTVQVLFVCFVSLLQLFSMFYSMYSMCLYKDKYVKCAFSRGQ